MRMSGEFICIVCPNGCPIDAVFEKNDDGTAKIIEAKGYTCLRGKAWVEREVESPMRTIATSVPVDGGDALMASVRTTQSIPRDKIFEVNAAIKQLHLKAPVEIGTVVLKDPAGCSTEVIVTRNVKAV